MFDRELYATWLAMHEEGRLGECLRMLSARIDAKPEDADLQLLAARTLLALDRPADSLDAARRAWVLSGDDPAVLVQVASMAFFAGDLTTAREVIDSAKKIAPRGFVFQKELDELDRNIAHRARVIGTEKRLVNLFELHPEQPEVVAALAHHLARNGQTFAAYHVVARGLRFNPSDRSLRRLERRLGPDIPPEARRTAHAWADSDLPFSIDSAPRLTGPESPPAGG